MSSFRIEGGYPLDGELVPMGNKNAALPMLAACLLTDEPVRLENVPEIEDVRSMLEALSALGVEIAQPAPGVCELHAAGAISPAVPAALCAQMRTSILFAGPLLARCGEALLAPPGGDIIGRRRLDTHFMGLQALGAEIAHNHAFHLTAPGGLTGVRVFLDEASVTATENLVMAAALARGRTVLINAACEPHVQDLCRLLNEMGACVGGIGTNRLVVDGVKRLRGASHRVSPDHVEIGSFIALAAATGGSLLVRDVIEEDLWMVQHTFAKVGIGFEIRGKTLVVPRLGRLVVRPDRGGMIPTIDDAPWPQFPSDLLSPLIVAATQAEGTLLFHEKLYESRMFFVDRLNSMGARIILCDPHRCVVNGPAQLHGAHLTSPDIRAGMALVIAALVASGESVIQNACMIDRGYERLEEKLQALGARIERRQD